MSVAAAHVPPRSSVARLATERSLALASIGLVGLHVADDNFLQPEPGMSAGRSPSGWARAARARGRGRVGVHPRPCRRPRGDRAPRRLPRRPRRHRGRLLHRRRRAFRRRLHRLPLAAGGLRAPRRRHHDALAGTPRTGDSRRRRYTRRGLAVSGRRADPASLVPDLDRVRRHAHGESRRAGRRTSARPPRTSPSRRATGFGSRAGSSPRGTAPP